MLKKSKHITVWGMHRCTRGEGDIYCTPLKVSMGVKTNRHPHAHLKKLEKFRFVFSTHYLLHGSFISNILETVIKDLNYRIKRFWNWGRFLGPKREPSLTWGRFLELKLEPNLTLPNLTLPEAYFWDSSLNLT
jgi:hypothetical protein